VDPAKNPEVAAHVEEAQAAGKPKVVKVGEREKQGERRREAMRGHPAVKGKDRDEYPPAWSAEGGKGASVKPIDPSQNRSDGAAQGQTIKNLPPGTKVEIRVKNREPSN
jgi:filamentous hemagglutinin